MRTAHKGMTITKNSLFIIILSTNIAILTYGCSSQDNAMSASVGVPNATNYVEHTKLKTANSNVTTSQITQSEEMITIDFTKCMNEEGISAPYPELNSDGSVKWGVLKGAIVNQNTGFSWESKKSKKALELCLPILENLNTESPKPKEDPVKLQDDLLRLVSCLRDKGFTLPDPEFSDDPRVAMKSIYQQFSTKSPGTSNSTKAERAFDLCNEAVFQDKIYK